MQPASVAVLLCLTKASLVKLDRKCEKLFSAPATWACKICQAMKSSDIPLSNSSEQDIKVAV